MDVILRQNNNSVSVEDFNFTKTKDSNAGEGKYEDNVCLFFLRERCRYTQG